jgi:hypothetical protein
MTPTPWEDSMPGSRATITPQRAQAREDDMLEAVHIHIRQWGNHRWIRACSLAALSPFALSGCAQLNSLNWPVNTEGKAVAIDAKQRVVISQKMHGGEIAAICAEPSPDALAAYGASIGGSVRQATGTQAQLATAIAEQAASIGLRTQSIQLMRDAMYRACEGYLSGGIGGSEFYSLQRRFQNLTLGLLAIEQLTGAVKADQATLSTNSAAGTGGNTEAEVAALGKAREDADAAKTRYDAAQAQLKTDQAAHAEAVKKLADAKKTLAANTAPTQADKDVVVAAETAAKAASEAVENQKLVLAQEDRALRTAQEMVKLATESLTAARLQVRAAASGTAALGISGASRAQIAEKVSDAVVSIVQKVFDESGKNEGCHGIISDFRARSEQYLDSPAMMSVLDVCLKEKALEVQERADQKGVPSASLPEVKNAPRPYPPPSHAPSPQ